MSIGGSMLRPGQRRLLVAVLAIAAFMLANTGYLVATRATGLAASPDAISPFYQAMVLAHTGLGLVLIALAAAFALWHLPRALRQRGVGRAMPVFGALLLASAIALAGTGLFIVTAANNRANRWAFYAHVGLAFAVLLLYALHRTLSLAPPRMRAVRLGLAGVAAAAAAIGALHLTTARPPAAASSAAVAASPTPRPPGALSVADLPPSPRSPFFPSPATTASGGTIPARHLLQSDTCKRCHASIHDQWSRSAHRFSSFNNPFYRATIEDMRANAPNGVTKSRWCAGCHDPMLLFPGFMDKPIVADSDQALAGLQCLACHSIDKVHDVRGNAGYNLDDERPDPYLFAGAEAGSVGAFIHDAAVKARPEAHKALMMKRPLFETSELCSVCHKVSLDVPVNDYRWIRGQNEYDAWHDSGVAWNAARTFYLPPAKKVCQDCHMPLEDAVLGDAAAKGGKVRSHRFLAVNTALPAVRGDEETIARTEAFLREAKLRVDIWPRAVDEATGTAEVHVVVRNLGVGHTFPGGTNDSNEGWLHVRAVEAATGKVLFESGAIDADGFVDPDAHFYGAVVVDRQSRLIDRRNAQDIHSAIYMHAIGPGSADVARYRFKVKDSGTGTGTEASTIRFEAALKWRKFKRVYTKFVEKAQPTPIPPLPVTTIVETAARVTGPGTDLPTEWLLWNDYGIALFLEDDLRAAEAAWRRVAELAPERVDGPRNLARIALKEGSISNAYALLAECEKKAPADPQTALFFGLAFLEDGRYAEAEQALGRCLERFPEDRQALKALGRARYLAGARDPGAYERALEAYGRVLAIDPEDRVAHYHRMLALRALGREEEAKRAEALYEKYQIDERAQEIQTPYRLAHPADHRESLPIHVHERSEP